MSERITIKSPSQLDKMRAAGRLVGETLNYIESLVRVGVSTWELDREAEMFIRSHGGIPSFLNYEGYPASICTSVNEQVVHGIPSDDVVLKEGDIISIDVGATYKGMVADSAYTYPVGEVTDEIKMLLETTKKSLYAGIEKMCVNNYLEDISGAIEDVAVEKKLGIVRQYGGHGVGMQMHMEPFLFNYRTGNKGPILKSGYVIAIEPMLNLGGDDVYTLKDEWTVVTKDGKPSAHFEHTVAVTDNGPLILTKRD